jgi:MFS family permease
MVTLHITTMFLHHLPAYYQELGASDELSGQLMSLLSLMAILLKLLAGVLFDKKGPAVATSYVLLPYAAGFLVLLQSNTSALVVGSILLSFGITSFTFLQPLLTRVIFSRQNFAEINSVCMIGCNLGIAVGSPTWSVVYDRTGSYHMGVLVAPLLIFIAYGVLLFFIRLTDKNNDK